MTPDRGGEAELLDVVTRFYAAENARRWDLVARFVHPAIRSTSWPSGQTVSGRRNYLDGMRRMYAGRESTFEVTAIAADPARATVLAELRIEGRSSVNVFELADGLIRTEREYLGEGYGDG